MKNVFWLSIGICILACGTSSVVAISPTRTPLPTLTPTPVFYKRDAAQIVRAIQTAGLETANVRPAAPEEEGVIPGLAQQGLWFSVPSICADCGGLVLSFDNPAALENAKAYYMEASARHNPHLSSWVFVKDNILLQLSGQIPEATALEYGNILVRLR